MKKIAIFASGNGSNAENIIRYFNEKPQLAEVSLVVCNKSDAGVLKRAEDFGVPTAIISKSELNNSDFMLGLLQKHSVDIIVLAGFLLMIPAFLTNHYKNRIVNIHPSLLPAYGGKGMFGRHVHEAVIAAGEKQTGITIHLVTDKYDDGAILFQANTEVTAEDTPESVEAKIHHLEKRYFPQMIEKFFCH